VFLHTVGSAGHVVHFGASGARNVNTLYFMLGWDWYRFHKKCVRTRYAELEFLHLVGPADHVVHSSASGGAKCQHTIFHAQVGLVRISQKCIGTRYAELVFLHLVGSVYHVVHSGASGVRNIDALFFILRWDPYGFLKAGTRLSKSSSPLGCI
jgi:hypothetical protein